jgi:hypothetical protein
MPLEPQIFISSAINYYVVGRFAVFAGLNPTAGNLLHHAVEMCLKGALAKKGWSLKDLKDKLGHDLRKIWFEFKTQYTSDPNGLNEFEATIAELHRFEDVRYPNLITEKGMLCDIGGGPPTAPRIGLMPSYLLHLDEIDRLVGKVFELASVNLEFFAPVLPLAMKYLNDENRGLAGPCR